MVVINRIEYLYPVLAVISIILIAWQHWGMNKTLQVYPDLHTPAVLLNDNISGGRSVGELTNVDGVLHLSCQTLKSPYTFAFCSVVLPIAQEGQGVDLSQYTQLDVWLEMESDSKDTVLVYLRNREISADSRAFTRSNVRAINPKPGMRHYSLKLNSFSVPSWWLFAHENSAENAETNFDNVSDIQISSGDNAFERQETIKIKQLELIGKWISSEKIYLLILISWNVLVFFHVLMGLIRLNKNLKKSRLQTMELESVNKFLCIENDKYETMAKVDPLTKAFNRAGVRDILDRVVAQFEKRKTPCSIIMFDIDYFKSINDQYGHDVGDEVLINLVAYVQKNSRENDKLARWGGEEFVLICPNTPLKRAVKIAEKLREGIAAADFIKPAITCSFGVSEIRSGDISVHFKRADVALYKAKSQGRNKVVG